MFMTTSCGHELDRAFHDEFVPEFRRLDPRVQDETYAVARVLHASDRSSDDLAWIRSTARAMRT